jgi:hypothetical protein
MTMFFFAFTNDVTSNRLHICGNLQVCQGSRKNWMCKHKWYVVCNYLNLAAVCELILMLLTFINYYYLICCLLTYLFIRIQKLFFMKTYSHL